MSEMMRRKTLEPFQAAGARFLAARAHALLADEPGLGKTLQAIAALELVNARNTLIVCPASVRSNWWKELVAWHGNQLPGFWQVISYNEAVSRQNMLRRRDAVILDEGHFLKTAESQRTRAVLGNDGLVRDARYIWTLTGTPVLNRPRELFPIVKTMCPAFATTTYAKFTQRYCGAFWDGRAINDKGNSHLDELNAKLSGFMLRRTKREVYPDRKEPLVSKVPVELSVSDLAAVIAAEDEIMGREVRISAAAEKVSQLGDTSRLLRLLGRAKVPHVVRFVKDQLETVDKLVVFAYHTDVIADLASALRSYGVVTLQGGMSDAAKTASVEAFQRPQTRVFIGQRTAAGTGINGLQTVCATAVIAEPSWVPGETEQMIDRLDRIGQKGDIVNAYILYAQATLDAIVVGVHDRKALVVDRVMANPLEGL